MKPGFLVAIISSVNLVRSSSPARVVSFPLVYGPSFVSSSSSQPLGCVSASRSLRSSGVARANIRGLGSERPSRRPSPASLNSP